MDLEEAKKIFNKYFKDSDCPMEEFEKFTKSIDCHDFKDEKKSKIERWLKSRGKSFEDYGLSEEAIICLKNAGCNNPQEVYEKLPLMNPYKKIDLRGICFQKKRLIDEIGKKLRIYDFPIENYPTNKDGGKIIVTENQEGFLKVEGKVREDEEGNAYVPTLCIIDSNGNAYTEEEFEEKYKGIERTGYYLYEKFIKNIDLEKELTRKKIYHLNQDVEIQKDNIKTVIKSLGVIIGILVPVFLSAIFIEEKFPNVLYKNNPKLIEVILVSIWEIIATFLELLALPAFYYFIKESIHIIETAIIEKPRQELKKSKQKYQKLEELGAFENINTEDLVNIIEEMYANGELEIDDISQTAEVVDFEMNNGKVKVKKR